MLDLIKKKKKENNSIQEPENKKEKEENKMMLGDNIGMEGLEYLDVLKDSTNFDDEYSKIKGLTENRPEIKFWNGLLKTALEKDVTDIHFEPELVQYYDENGKKIEAGKIIIRFNIHGEKVYFYELQPEIYFQIIRIVKDKYGMLADETNIQQNGSGEIKAEINGKIVKKRLRFSIIPTVYKYEDLDVVGLGNVYVENLVVRLLANKIYSITELGLLSYRSYLTSALQETGAVLFTGPTSHGKTTTQVAALDFIRKLLPNRKYYSVENPVEIIVSGIAYLKDKKYVPGVTPIELKERLPKKAIQQHLLRGNPDVVVIGELTQDEDIQFAKNMSNTGHTVVGTMHTESTVELRTRLEAERINYDSFIQVVKLIISQRLLRLPYKTISVYNFKKQIDKYKHDLTYKNFFEEWNNILRYNVFSLLIRPNILGQRFYDLKLLKQLQKQGELKYANIENLEKFYKYLKLYFYGNQKYPKYSKEVFKALVTFIEKNIYISDILTDNEKLILVDKQFTKKEIESVENKTQLFTKLRTSKGRFPVFEFAILSDPKIKKHFTSKEVGKDILNDDKINFLTIFQDAFIKSVLFGGEGFHTDNKIKSFDILKDDVLKGLAKHDYGINKFIEKNLNELDF